MKLFQPREANKLVYAVIGKNEKDGAKPRYIAIEREDQESAEGQIDAKALKSCYPHPMGRYDEQGRYCTYKPPIDGIAPGRYVLHPLAYQEWLDYEKGVY